VLSAAIPIFADDNVRATAAPASTNLLAFM
jgi:hypothetical protein